MCASAGTQASAAVTFSCASASAYAPANCAAGRGSTLSVMQLTCARRASRFTTTPVLFASSGRPCCARCPVLLRLAGYGLQQPRSTYLREPSGFHSFFLRRVVGFAVRDACFFALAGSAGWPGQSIFLRPHGVLQSRDLRQAKTKT